MFTIGYATKSISSYIEQLHEQKVTVVADIRSVPYSKVFFDYHQEALKQHLRNAGIRYVYLGDELGPRSKDSAHYDDTRQVQFYLLMQATLYQSGIQRLFDGIDKGFNIALTCACKDPAICHRSLLVGWSLKRQNNYELQHILHDGGLESQTELEHRLLQMTGTVPDMFSGEAGALKLAYARQCQASAYRKPAE
ncbi:MAG: DUF488 domain-containing protein [Pseudohongiella sp.]|nr:DUF488 domain-containing protein [Pseudohongiella sp.]MDO9518902.1 DUF488 domain-containing protein [Pseudohongiella sp.]MDP2126424.1 DUF488 domain-containing protein [Pseudohongiella sp.]